MDLLLILLFFAVQHTKVGSAQVCTEMGYCTSPDIRNGVVITGGVHESNKLCRQLLTKFKLDVCSTGEVTATTVSKSIYSPNFPSNYPNDLDCSTRIISPENTVIELFFEAFQLSYSEGCTGDFLQITSRETSRVLQPSCGPRFFWPDYPDKIVSRGNEITVKFVSDGRISDLGFNATFRAVHPSPYLFIMAENATIRVADRHNGYNFVVTPDGVTDPLAVDYDPKTQYVVYSDRGTKSIGKFHSDRRLIHEVLHSEYIEEPLGLRIDVNSGLLYWTDAELGTVSVSNLDGEFRNTLIKTELEKPGGIVTEPYEGYIYFTDFGSNPKIERADGDGRNRFVLVDSLIVSPRALAIDLKERILYWIDDVQKSLEKVKYDGTGRTLLKFVSQFSIFSLTLDDYAFFWSGRHPSESEFYIRLFDRKLETTGYYVKWGSNKHYKGISLRPYQEADAIAPDTCPAADCNGLCLPKPNGRYVCLADDVTPPSFLNCPTHIIAWVGPGKSSSSVSWDEIFLEDENDFVVSSSHVSGSEFYLGKAIVVIAARDLAGNKAWCNFSVVVNEDEIPPVIKPCPEDISVSVTSPSETEQIVTFAEPELSDNSGEAHWLEKPSSLDTTFPIGSTVINYIASDQFGNQAQCSFLVIVSGYSQTTPTMEYHPPTNSLTLYLVIGMGSVLIVLGLVAVALIVVAVCKCHSRQDSSTRDHFVDNACTNGAYATHMINATATNMTPVVSFPGKSVRYIKPQTEINYGDYIDFNPN